MEKTSNYMQPSVTGKFGEFGGRFVPETLMSALHELETVYESTKTDIFFL